MATVRERLTILARAAVGVFHEGSGQQVWGLLGGLWPGSAGEAPDRGTVEHLRAYSRMPWVRSAAGRASEGVASTQWQVFAVRQGGRARRVREVQAAPHDRRRRLLTELKQAGQLELLADHPLQALLDGGNSFLTGHSVWRVTQIHLDLVGEAFWLKERNALGVPIASWPLPPHWVRETPTPARRTFRLGIRGWQVDVPDTEVTWFVNPNPENPYGRGTGLTQALADELETDEFAAKFLKGTFLNRARPDLIISPKGDGVLRKEDTDRLERGWLDRHQGFWRTMKPLFLPRGVDVKELAQNFRELQMVELRRYERDVVRQVYSIPPEILGDVSNSNRASSLAADFHFARWVLVPRLELLRTQLQERLVPEFDDKLIVHYVSPVEEDEEFVRGVMKDQQGSFLVDEHRALAGRPPLPNGAGQVVLRPMTVLEQPVTGVSVPGQGRSLALAHLTVPELLQLRGLLTKAEAPAEGRALAVTGASTCAD